MADNITFSNQTNNTSGTKPGPSTGFPPIPSLTTGDIVNIVFLCILAVMIVFANSLMIGAFYVNTRLRKRTNFLLMSLAVADMLVGTISLPLLVYISITLSPARPESKVYRIYITLDVICAVSSILNLTVISLERCYALIRPVKHRNITKRMFVAVIVVTWILATLVGTSVFLALKYRQFYSVTVTVVFFFVPLAIILGAYGTIFHVARTHARGREVGSFKKDLRIAVTVAVITGLFVICLTPFFAVNFAFSVCGRKRWMTSGCLGMLKLPPVVHNINKWLQYGNSFCNPIIYGLRNEEFRRTFRVILLRLCCKKVRITEYDKNLYEGARKARSTRRQREAWRENVELQSVRIVPSPEPYLELSDSRENHSEEIQSSNPIKLESLIRKSLTDSLKELNKDHVFQIFSSGVTSTVAGPSGEIAVAAHSAACCNPAFEHDPMENGNYPTGPLVLDSPTENINVHKRSTEVSVHETRHHFTDSKILNNHGGSKSTMARILSEITVCPSGETALECRLQLKSRSLSFP